MKKLVVAFLALLGVLTLSACNTQASQNNVLASNTDIYAFSAISSTSLLSQGSQTQPLAKTLGDSEDTLIEQEIEDINKYLNMMEQFLGDNGGFSIENVESDRVEYANKVVFTSVDLLGNQVVHTLYFNEEVLTEENDVDDLSDYTTEDDDEEEVDNEEETEVEDETEIEDDEEDEFEDQETKITGILVMNDTEYTITGKKEIEENEEKIEIKSFVDANNYVKVVSKVEDDERKYHYEVVTDGVVVMSSKVKIEEEDNESKFVLEYVDGQTSGKFEFKRELDDNEDIIKIKYEINNGTETETGEAKILVMTDSLTGDTTYQYKVKTDDDQEIELEEEREDEDDEEEDDEEVDETSFR